MKDLMKLHDAAVAAALAVAAKNLGDRDIPSRSELEVAVTEQAEEIERLTLRLKMTSDTMNGYMLERNALQAKLDTATQSSAHWQHQYTEVQAKLYAMESVEPQPPFGSKRKAAMAVYTPPFKYEHGYILDSQNLMVADDGDIAEEKRSVTGAVASRVRGWGRLSYLPNGAELQDEIGQMMADALNALYAAPKVAQQPCLHDWLDATDGRFCLICHASEAAIGGQQP